MRCVLLVGSTCNSVILTYFKYHFAIQKNLLTILLKFNRL
jgi:hypothetical protein